MAESRTRPGEILDDDFMRRIERLRLVSRRVIQGRIRGERITRRRGRGVEFADYRDYAVGDDLRFLDWNLYARLDRLFLKLFLEEEDLHVYLLVDASASMGFGDPSKLHYARRVTAALAYIALSNYDRVFLGALAGGDVEGLGPLRGKHQVLRLLEFLAAMEARGPTALAPALRQFTLAHRRKGVVVLISDLLDKAGAEPALKYFAAARQDVFLLHVLAREEIRPNLAGDLRLIDLEDADATEVTISAPLLRQYRRTLETFVASLKTCAGRRGINYLLASTAVPFDRLVLDYLRRRGLVE